MKRALLVLLLCVMFVATTFGLDLSIAPGLSIKNAFLYTIVVIYMIETAVFHNRRFELASVIVPFALLVGYSILSWFTVAFVVQSPRYLVLEAAISLKANRFDHLLLFLLFFYALSSREDVLALLRMFLWILVFGNLITVVDGFDIPDLGIIQQREDGRMGGPMGESNQYGALIALTLPAIAALAWDSKTKKILAYFGSFVSIVALLVASSRGAFVGLIVGSLFSIFYLRNYISMRRVAIGSIVTLGIIIVLVIVLVNTELVSELIQRFTDKLSGSAGDISSNRTNIWLTALRQMSESPLSFFTGFGWNAYDYINRIGVNTHNVYLNHLFNLGLLGLVLYCLLMYQLIANGRKAISVATDNARYQLIAFVFGLSSLCFALFFVDLYQAWNWIWAYAGLVMRLAVSSLKKGELKMSHTVKSSIKPSSGEGIV